MGFSSGIRSCGQNLCCAHTSPEQEGQHGTGWSLVSTRCWPVSCGRITVLPGAASAQGVRRVLRLTAVMQLRSCLWLGSISTNTLTPLSPSQRFELIY